MASRRRFLVFWGIVVWVWYLIYRYLGHEPLIKDACIKINCNFPEHYQRNSFGDIWIYSPLWLIILIVFIMWAHRNWASIKVKKFKAIIITFIAILWIPLSIVISLIVKEELDKIQFYDDALIDLEEKNYLLALDNFEEVKDYKDSKKQIDKIHSEIVKLVPEMIEKEMFWDGYYLDEYLEVLSDVPKYEKKANELAEVARVAETENLVKTRAELSRTAPYEGMSEENVRFSEWGPPTEINKAHDYDSLREERRVKHYKWIEKDEFGRTVTIKSLMVKQGAVWGEPHISRYYQIN